MKLSSEPTGLSEEHTTRMTRKDSAENQKSLLYPRPKLRSGKLLPEEWDRFKQALLIYGRDWRMIEWKVGTRRRQILMSFAHKFKEKMRRISQTSTDADEVIKCKAYITVLESKQHKTFSR